MGSLPSIPWPAKEMVIISELEDEREPGMSGFGDRSGNVKVKDGFGSGEGSRYSAPPGVSFALLGVSGFGRAQVIDPGVRKMGWPMTAKVFQNFVPIFRKMVLLPIFSRKAQAMVDPDETGRLCSEILIEPLI